jgi:hypothetical protein
MIYIESAEKIGELLEKARLSAKQAHEHLLSTSIDSVDLMFSLKFEPIGSHPITHHKINLIEQINQFWTFVTALTAAREILKLHPDVGGLALAPGAHAAQQFDIMSRKKNVLAAEVFAAVDPTNNGKIKSDVDKLANDKARYRYVFFMSPGRSHLERHEKYESGGVQVLSVVPFFEESRKSSSKARESSGRILPVTISAEYQNALVSPVDAYSDTAKQGVGKGAVSPLQYMSFRESFDPNNFRAATEKSLLRSLVDALPRSGDTANLVLNSIQIAKGGKHLIVAASPEVQKQLAAGLARIGRSAKLGSRLPQVVDAKTGKIIEIMKESRGATALSRAASFSNVIFSAAHLISSYDIAQKLGVIDSKLDLLVEFRRIDQAAILERIFASAKELCALQQSTERDLELWRLRGELRELRAVWRREVSHHLSSIDDPAQRDFFSRTFTFQSSVDSEIHGKISRGELQMVFLEYALRLDYLLSEAGNSRESFLAGLRDELEELRDVGRLLDAKAAFISKDSKDKDPQPTIARLNGILESYDAFASLERLAP